MSDLQRVQVYASGLCSCSVCSDLDDIDQITRIVNLKNPTGITHAWVLSDNKTFADGTPMPAPCNYHPDTHKHYLFEC